MTVAGKVKRLRLEPLRSADVPSDSTHRELSWIVQPENGRPAWSCDFSTFAYGDCDRALKARPELIAELVPALEMLTLGKSWQIEDVLKSSLRLLWSFLDSAPPVPATTLKTVQTIPPTFGGLFRLWLITESEAAPNVQSRALNTTRRVFTVARRLLGMEDWDLPWPSIPRPKRDRQRDVEPGHVKLLYTVLKAWHWNFRTALGEGKRLRALGSDPRSKGDGRDRDAWANSQNQAVLADLFVADLSIGQVSQVRDYDPWFAQPANFGLRLQGPEWPGARPLTPFDRARWSVPLLEDVAAAISLVLLHTGWNVDTVLSLDVSADSRWFDRRAGDGEAGSVAIYALKRRTNREQIATSLVRPFSHPFAVIETMRLATEPLRRAVRHQLAELEATQSPHQVDPQLSRLKAMASSPWLYLSRTSQGAGRVGWVSMSGQVFRTFNRFAREASSLAAKRGEDTNVQEAISSLRMSDLRDGYAAFLNEGSLFNTFLVKRALGHNSLRTTMRYLDKKRDVARRYREYAQFQENLFDEIATAGRVDSTVLMMRTRVGPLTAEQRARLGDHRQRTRMGMGCLDPMNPPIEIAPGHSGGPCAVQRCTLCQHGVVFSDSWPALAKRAAELEHIRGRTPQERFVDSSFYLEWIAIESLIKKMNLDDQAAFGAAVAEHLSLLRDHKVYLFEQSIDARS